MDFANYWFSSAAGGGGFEIDNSLRFRGAQYLSRTPGTAGNRNTWTTSYWIKKAPAETSSAMHTWSSTDFSAASFNGGNTSTLTGGTSGATVFNTTAKYKDPSAWMHIVTRYDSTQSGSNKYRIYINGAEYTGPWLTDSRSGLGTSSMNNTVVHYVGNSAIHGGTTFAFQGYMAEFHHVDGSSLDPTNFGEFNADGVWVPINVTGVTYGTNGFYLDFSDPANIGADRSGNGNNFTPTGFTTSGTGTDVMSDTPTTNYCTWNPVAKGPGGTYPYQVLSNGNLQHQYKRSGMGDWFAEASFALAGTENYYWEVKVVATSSDFCLIGICEQDWTWNSSPTVRYVSSDGKISNHVSDPQNNPNYTGATYGNGDVIGCAWNGTNKTLQFYKNGSAQGSPLSPTVTTGKTFVPCWHAASDNWEVVLNCGQRAFEYTPPTGYKTLSTDNLPAPDIADGSQYFNTVLYTANASSKSITGVGFQPDWVWIKNRDSNLSHRLYDAVRGTTKQIYSDDATSEATDSNSLTSFDSDGFSIGSSDGINRNGEAHVAWCWDAGGSGSSNTSGSITSTVSANPTAGFSIVSYTGPGSGTVGHGLGVAPQLILVKNRSITQQWAVYSEEIGNDKFLVLNDTSASSSSNSAWWNSTSPTSTVFSVGTDNMTGGSYNYIAYCFAEVEGYSKFGSYTGNGSSDGAFVYCGFKPAWVIIKSVDNAGKWIIQDTVRNPYNLQENILCAEDTRAEATFASIGATGWIDGLSNGFKIRDSWSDYNTNGNDFIFAAFAEHPFGGSGVSPATAR